MTIETPIENGRLQIESAFRIAQERQIAALMPYFTLGYPDIATSLDIIESVAANSDLLELGLPFRDPLADGPTIQTATYTALTQGTTVVDCLAQVRELRDQGVLTEEEFETKKKELLDRL